MNLLRRGPDALIFGTSPISALIPQTIEVLPNLQNADPSAVDIDPKILLVFDGG